MTVRRAVRRLALLLALTATAAFAQLDKAEKAISDLEYAKALKALELAKKQVGNDERQTRRILELQAVTLATLGQQAKALKAFQALLSLVPDFKLSGNYPPRVATVLFEARGWLDASKPLEAAPLPATREGELVTGVRLAVTNDPLKLVKEVRFHLRADGRASEFDVPLSGTAASAPVRGEQVAWWAELLGERKAVLQSLGTADAPRREGVVPPPDVERPPEPVVAKPATSEPAPVVVVSAPQSGMSGGRVGAVVLGGVGVAAVAAGAAFGMLANNSRERFATAETDGAGRIISLTQKEALALDAEQRAQATAANVLLIGGGVLVATGVTLWLVSKPEVAVAVVPAPGGAGLVGRF